MLYQINPWFLTWNLATNFHSYEIITYRQKAVNGGKEMRNIKGDQHIIIYITISYTKMLFILFEQLYKWKPH